MRPLWLASGSPRRKSLLEWAGFQVEVRPTGVPEERGPGEDPVAYAERLALTKRAGAPPDRLALAADTVVHRGELLLEKPLDRDEARAHLRTLSGGWHQVTTAVCVGRGPALRLLHVTTDVRFRALTEGEIMAYVATGEADDKASAYGIQGRGGVFVAELRGSWTNVMGLPMEEVIMALQELEP